MVPVHLLKTHMPLAHSMPQAPQLYGSLLVLVQMPEQQTSPVGHTAPQAPQLFGLVLVLTHVPEQFVWPRRVDVSFASLLGFSRQNEERLIP
jgi:hypothetical protein